jgi:outer membrane lipoprotein-sorting protein
LKSIFKVIFLTVVLWSTGAQDLRSPKEHFQEVSAKYSSITDYRADLTITQGESVQTGVVYFKSPNKIRVDFSNPRDQVIVSNGRKLTVYLPRNAVIYNQELPRSGLPAGQLTGEGLRLMLQNFGIAYLTSPQREPLEENGGGPRVYKFKLNVKNYNESYIQLIVSVQENNLIRRMVGLNRNGITVQFDYTNIQINQGLSDNLFEYDSDPRANVINDFLYDPGN